MTLAHWRRHYEVPVSIRGHISLLAQLFSRFTAQCRVRCRVGPISYRFASCGKKRSAGPAFSDVFESFIRLVERLADGDGKA